MTSTQTHACVCMYLASRLTEVGGMIEHVDIGATVIVQMLPFDRTVTNKLVFFLSPLSARFAMGGTSTFQWRIPLLCAVLGAGVYLNSLEGEMVMDDSVAVVGNKDIRPNSTWTDVFFNDYWGTPIATEESHKSYRPFTVLTFRFNFWLNEILDLDGLHVVGFHVLNVVCHSLVTFLVTLVGYGIEGENFEHFALFSGVLFATHPVHTEAVASIVGRAEMLCALPYILGILVYINPSKRSFSSTLLACVLATVAMLFKETGYMSILVFILFDLCDWVMGHVQSFPFVRGITCCCFALGLVMARVSFTKTSFGPTFSDVDNYIHYIENNESRVLTYMHLHLRYLQQLVYPVNLSCDWSYKAFPIVTNLIDVRNLYSICMYASALFVFLCGIKTKSRTIIYAFFLSVIPFIPASNILFPVATVLGERLLYLPSVGFCFLAAFMFCKICQLVREKTTKNIVIAAFVALVGFYISKTIARNEDWRTPEKLFKSATAVVPESCKAWICLASAYKETGRHQLAREAIKISLDIKPDFAGAHFLKGNLEQAEGNVDAAIDAFERTVVHSIEKEFKPDILRVALNNLGVLFLKSKKNPRQAVHALEEAMKIAPDNYALNANLGEAYAQLRNYDKAIKCYRKAKEKNENPDLLNNLAIAIYQSNVQRGGKEGGMQVLDQVRALYERVVSIDSTHYNANLNIGKICYQLKDYDQAVFHLQKALERQPADPPASDLLGRSYMQINMYDKAISVFKLALNSTESGDYQNRMKTNLQSAIAQQRRLLEHP